jgi:hypothetical protein
MSDEKASPEVISNDDKAKKLAANLDRRVLDALVGVIKRDFGISLPHDDPLLIAFYVFNMTNSDHLTSLKAELDESTSLFKAEIENAYGLINGRATSVLNWVDAQAKLSINKEVAQVSYGLEALVQKTMRELSSSMQKEILANIQQLTNVVKNNNSQQKESYFSTASVIIGLLIIAIVVLSIALFIKS